MTTHRQLRAWVRLSLCRSVGPRTWNQWLVELQQVGLTLEDFFDLPDYEARRLLTNHPQIAHALRHVAPSQYKLDEIMKRLACDKIRLVPITDLHYPVRLLHDLAFDAPPFLYVIGNLVHLRSPTIALVGTRYPSPQGQETAHAYGAALARRGIHVVSGHARGIDTAAHQGALVAGGSTTLVLPCGIFAFRLSPSLERLATTKNILVLSQFSPDATVGREMPVLRNTTIASLADGLVVIESRLRGGSAHAFRQARHLRKPLWTVIYRDPIPLSASGNHSLIAAGAQAIRSGELGAEQCAGAMADGLRHSRRHRLPRPAWPPPTSPGQCELF